MSEINRSLAEARSIRYLIDALVDKKAANLLINDNQLPPALFHIAQLCEKSTKACLATINILITEDQSKGPSLIKEHIYSNLVKTHIMPVSGELKESFNKLIPRLKDIETYYIDPRYGVDKYGRISLDEYKRPEVEEFFSYAIEYLELCFKFFEEKYGKPVPREVEELKKFFKSNYTGFVTR